jgi:uncharacterized protein with HEPN domain
MTRPEALVLLGHIEESAVAIENAARGRSLDDYLETRILRSSIEREFIIIGEALKNALAIEPELPVTQGRRIVNFRNLLVIQRDLPRLLAEVRALLPPA